MGHWEEWDQWKEGAGTGRVHQWKEGGAEGGWVEGVAVGSRESGEGRGQWCSKRRVVQWEKGEAVGHVVMFHPPN